MKKNKKNLNTQGFVMSELLAGAIVILLLFSILFANYLPLSGEFATRTTYTNLTSNYGAFYVRKIYKTLLEEKENMDLLKQALTDKGYYTVYSSKNPDTIQLAEGNLKSDMSSVIDQYQIEEVIITKYKTDEVKKGSKRYTRDAGELYNYIKYLPYYKWTAYDGNKEYEPYRLIIKTGYGYATTQIFPDPPTPISCFDLQYQSDKGGFAIIDYHRDEEECGENVVITPVEINHGGQRGRIIAITNHGSSKTGAFENKRIKTVTMSVYVTTIGDNAFKNNNIAMFTFEDNAPGVESVGEAAFSNNKFTKITIPATITQLGKRAFANNYDLKVIDIDYNSLAENETRILPEGLFALDTPKNITDDADLIDLFIPANVSIIKEGAFHNLQFAYIEFEDIREGDNNEDEVTTEDDDGEVTVEASKPTKLIKIEKDAFKIDGGIKTTPEDNYLSIAIPHAVKEIGESAFENVKIEELEFEDTPSSDLMTIGDKAFKVSTQSAYSSSAGRSLKIPASVVTIGKYAFENQNLSSLELVTTSSGKLERIEERAFSGNNLQSRFIVPKNTNHMGTAVFGNSNGIKPVDVNGIETKLYNFSWCDILYGGGCQYGRAYKVYTCKHEYYCGCTCGCDDDGKNCDSCCYCTRTYTKNYCLDYNIARSSDDKEVQYWNQEEGGCDDGDEKTKESDIKIGTPDMHCP